MGSWRVKDRASCAMLPRSARVEKKDFDVDIELIRVDDYALYGLVYHYIPERGRRHLVTEHTRYWLI